MSGNVKSGTNEEARRIRKRLDEIAPYPPDGAVTALALARQQAAEAQIAWARMMGMSHPITMQDIVIAHGCFGVAHTLLALHEADPAKADAVAAQIRDAWEDGGGVGEWIWEHHGGHAREIAGLADKLAELTEPAETTHAS
jgi:hypothetical protein